MRTTKKVDVIKDCPIGLTFYALCSRQILRNKMVLWSLVKALYDVNLDQWRSAEDVSPILKKISEDCWDII